MNFEDIDIGSLRNQKVPYPIIDSIVLNDADQKISLDIQWSLYAPLVDSGKDIFDSYKQLLTTKVTLFTFDISPMLNAPDFAASTNGPFIKLDSTFEQMFKMFLGMTYKNNTKTTVAPQVLVGNTETLDDKKATLFSFGGEKIRKFGYKASFSDMKPHHGWVVDPKTGKLSAPNFGEPLGGPDRIVDLMGVIEISADFSKGNLPFAITKAKKCPFKETSKKWCKPSELVPDPPTLNYAFPFVIAKNGDANFAYQTLQTTAQKIWTGPFTVTEENDIETITKLPIDKQDPDLSFVTITDPNVISNFVGTHTGDFFQFDFNKPEFSQKAPAAFKGYAGAVGTAMSFAADGTTALVDYFDSQKVEKIESPLSEMFFWDDEDPNTLNLAFEFDVSKFMNSSAFDYQNTQLQFYADNIKRLSLFVIEPRVLYLLQL